MALPTNSFPHRRTERLHSRRVHLLQGCDAHATLIHTTKKTTATRYDTAPPTCSPSLAPGQPQVDMRAEADVVERDVFHVCVRSSEPIQRLLGPAEELLHAGRADLHLPAAIDLGRLAQQAERLLPSLGNCFWGGVLGGAVEGVGEGSPGRIFMTGERSLPSGLPTAKKVALPPRDPSGPGEAVMLKYDTCVVFGVPWAAGWCHPVSIHRVGSSCLNFNWSTVHSSVGMSSRGPR